MVKQIGYRPNTISSIIPPGRYSNWELHSDWASLQEFTPRKVRSTYPMAAHL
jgi:hypothetical protein